MFGPFSTWRTQTPGICAAHLSRPQYLRCQQTSCHTRALLPLYHLPPEWKVKRWGRSFGGGTRGHMRGSPETVRGANRKRPLNITTSGSPSRNIAVLRLLLSDAQFEGLWRWLDSIGHQSGFTWKSVSHALLGNSQWLYPAMYVPS